MKNKECSKEEATKFTLNKDACGIRAILCLWSHTKSATVVLYDLLAVEK